MNDTETFQHYQVLKREDGSLWELGRGAMGVTYKAFDVNLRCHVALKVISGQFLDSEMARARFLREARAAAGLRHRNVASVYHLGDDTDSFFYSMEFIDGLTVESLVAERGPLPAADALQVALQVTRALGAAAKQGVVHRDIKPANLMVVHEDDEEEGGFVVKVIDFGLARSAVAGGENSGHITMGGFVGTPQYASPEQIEEKDLDVRSDIYSLGITLWYMLTGQPPFTGTVFRISSQHLTKEPPWEDIEGTVPGPVRDLLGRMLQKSPDQRPQTPAKLRAEIDACLRELPAGKENGRSVLPVAATTDTTFPDEETSANATIIQGPAPTAGRIFAGRYQLAELAGEGRSGRTFRAYDGRLDGKLVALKVLHPELNLSPQAFYHLQGDLGRLRDAPHPQLIETCSLERVHGYKFSVMEWINGYPLGTVVPNGGAWPVRDALRLLGLVADAAAHASAHRLHRLELHPHKILLQFPDVREDDAPPSAASLADQPLDRWPRFGLKLDALAPAREAGRSSTRGGGAGSAPRSPARDTLSSIRGLVEGSYFYALGTLLDEWLGERPPTPDTARDFVPLAALSEAGNAVLARAFSTNPGFATENEFFQALLQSCGLRREDVGLGRPLADDPSPSSVRTTVRAGTSAPTLAPPGPAAPTTATNRLLAENRVRQAMEAPLPTRPRGTVRPPPQEERTLTPDRAETFVPTPVATPRSSPVEARVLPVALPVVPASAAPPSQTGFAPEATMPLAEPAREERPPTPVPDDAPPAGSAASLPPPADVVAAPPPAVFGRAEAGTVAPAGQTAVFSGSTRQQDRRKSLAWAAVTVAVVGGVAAFFTWSKPKVTTPAPAATPVPPTPAADVSAPTERNPATSAAPAVDQSAHPPREVASTVNPTPEPVREEPAATMEAVTEEIPAPAPVPPAVAPATALPTPAPSPVTAVPAPTPRRDNKAPTSAPTPKAKPPNGSGVGGKPRSTPPKPVKGTPPPPPRNNNEEVPAFMR